MAIPAIKPKQLHPTAQPFLTHLNTANIVVLLELTFAVAVLSVHPGHTCTLDQKAALVIMQSFVMN